MSNKPYGQETQDYSKSDNRAGNAADKVKNISNSVKEAAKQTFDDMQSNVEEFGDTIKEKGQYLSNQIRDRVQNNPWAFIGGAAIAAMTLGFLFGRRRSSI
ncbi:MAG: hypothetical protein JWQ35_2137 [Bacteriovoracaceae bacterium]|nr:hypothetical protein [Bacteriovoracaceae bacterium]